MSKEKKSILIKVIIIIVVALVCYSIGSSLISGMEQAAADYNTK